MDVTTGEEEDIDRRGSLPATPRGQRMTDMVAFQVAIQFIIFFKRKMIYSIFSGKKKEKREERQAWLYLDSIYS